MSSTENLRGNDGDGEGNNSPSLNSIKSFVSSLKRAATNDSKKSDASTDSSRYYDPQNIPADPLPDDRSAIEGLLNQQLSALDHLRRTVVARNQEIKDYCSRAAYYYNMKPRVSPSFLRQLDTEIYIIRQQRNGLQALVEMRHNEIVRMAEHRKKLDADQGMDCTVYDMYLNFRRIGEWEQLFSI
ncbi:uncharacterized protein Z520_00400 [Fonsecaea multimorphosa CBS 102226]|uniref:Uncharacterized protein n=1 Tax=Fonsecaea multimorphosa CBS 102226 TaxID=1442371 RepID=A0A0D2L3S2_9EURO|nr:uncharacterized protein Z520_00400 [Fonsecaea multimorphosa CBS 102226]KIY03709.1 hypothetical protein Z520_00400 [Fonsecaea multimorphosa CBS 102226]OAL32409.1 hypothetical protein AYO22_00431 [Fonsecaea multimorphosa]